MRHQHPHGPKVLLRRILHTKDKKLALPHARFGKISIARSCFCEVGHVLSWLRATGVGDLRR